MRDKNNECESFRAGEAQYCDRMFQGPFCICRLYSSNKDRVKAIGL